MATELSMSLFKNYTECKKKYEYGYVRGLVPINGGSTDKMDIGTLVHGILAEIYSQSPLGQRVPVWNDTALTAVIHSTARTIMRDGYDYHGERRALKLEPKDVDLACEMVAYYWDQIGKFDAFTVVAVEEPFVLTLPDGSEIRNTFDLVVRENGRLVVYDHKTVGSIKDSLKYLPLDIQTNFYLVAAWKHFGFPVEFVHNFIRRAVPKQLTATGRVSTASKDPDDYLKRVRSLKQTAELQYLYDYISDLNDERRERIWYPREPQKSYTGCSSCAYYSVCSAEQTGKTVSDSMLAMQYTINLPEEEAVPA